MNSMSSKIATTHGSSTFAQKMAAAVGLLLACGPGLHGQGSEFRFDANGNLLTESPATVAPPQILSQPQSQVLGPGELASFFVVVADSRGLTYQWRFNDADINGATHETLLLTNVDAMHEGQYSVALANPSGTVTSATATLMLDSDLDHMADAWELANFGSLTHYASGDFDGDGVSNLTELQDGTSPTNRASALFRLTLLSDGGTVSVLPNQLTYTNGEVVTVTVTVNPGERFQGWTGAATGTNNPAPIVMTTNQILFAHFGAYAITWTNGASGNWHMPIHWSPNLVPNEDDDVAITSSATIAVNDDAHCRDLSLPGSSAVNFNGAGAVMFATSSLNSSMTLGGNSALIVLGEFDWSGGTMGGSGRTVIVPGAVFNMSSSSVHFLSGGRTLENGGTILWSGGFLTMGGATITNRAGAFFDMQTAVTVNSGGGNRFDNAGTFRKSINAGTATWPMTFNNSGLVEIATGRLALSGAGTNTGMIEIAAGASLNLSSGGVAFTSTSGSSISGAGDFIVSGNATLSGLVHPSGTHTFSGGTVNLNGDYTCTNSPATISGGTVNFNSASAVPVVNLSGGTLAGSGVLNVLNEMNWSGGNMGGSGRVVIAPAATLNFVSGITVTITSRTLENAGTVIWTGAGNLTGNAAVITNRPGALFELRNNTSFAPQGFVAWRFDNAGTLRKAVADGTATFAAGLTFNNYGTVEVQTGTLLVSAACANSGAFTLSEGTALRFGGGGSSSGSFIIPATALLEWTANNIFALNAGAQLNGAGLYRRSGGTLTFNTDATVDNLDVSGTVNGAGVVTVNNAMHWTSGTMSGSGRTRIAPNATLHLNNPGTLILQRTLENGGTALWTGANITLGNAVITNRAEALFHAQNAASLMQQVGANRFDNAGTFRKSGTTGTTTLTSGVTLNNYNTVEIINGILAANGGFTSRINSLLHCAIGGTTAGTGFGQLQVAGTVALNGVLSVDLTSGYVPMVNDSFTVLSAGVRNGSFANFFDSSPEVTMELSDTPNSVIVRVTDVAPPMPLLLQPELSGADIRLIWTTVSNITYRLEFRSDLDATDWNALPGDITSLSNTASKFDTLTPSNRFYRVRIVP